MCGRYYVDDDFDDEIVKICKKIDKKMLKQKVRTGDVVPSTQAPIITSVNKQLQLNISRWGYMSRNNRIINARAEGIEKKALFFRDLATNRCIIPASGFYEWNKNHEKSTFSSKDKSSRILYMAGIYRYNQLDSEYVIITTAANPSMKPVHDRMPLVLDYDKALEWLNEPMKCNEILSLMPKDLNRYTSNEQLEFKFD